MGWAVWEWPSSISAWALSAGVAVEVELDNSQRAGCFREAACLADRVQRGVMERNRPAPASWAWRSAVMARFRARQSPGPGRPQDPVSAEDS